MQRRSTLFPSLATAVFGGVTVALWATLLGALLATSCTTRAVTNETLQRERACADSIARGDTSDICRSLAEHP